ncbi:MAG: hypothetical protein ACXABG_08550, partial [Promethearchaeota archaeon]
MQNKDYLLAVKAFLAKNYRSEVVSLILFGSMVENQKPPSTVTDVDLLVVIKDSCSDHLFNKIYRELIAIQELYLPQKDSFIAHFSKGLQRATGMFINLFFCRYSDLKSGNFAKVFGVNLLMAFLFAPKTSVWISLKQRHIVLWGEDIIDKSLNTVKFLFSDVLRSFALNILLSLGAVCLGFFSKSMSQYAMEAVKWSLFTWKNFLQYPDVSLNLLCNR